MKSSIEVSNLGVRYSNGLVAINNINFTLNEGNICALLGANGAGKSTLFKAILGLETSFSGSVKICGLDVSKAGKRNLISYVPQNENVDWNFPITVFDVIMQGRYNYMGFFKIPKKQDIEIVNKYAKLLGIEHLLDRQIGELSGGQKKRVFVTRALSQESRIILLDEPFTGVDSKTEQDLMNLFIDLKKENFLILISTHNLSKVKEFCSQALLLHKTILGFGNINEVFTDQNLKKIFGEAFSLSL